MTGTRYPPTSWECPGGNTLRQVCSLSLLAIYIALDVKQLDALHNNINTMVRFLFCFLICFVLFCFLTSLKNHSPNSVGIGSWGLEIWSHNT